MGAGYGVPLLTQKDERDKRRHGRVRCTGAMSDLGRILDLSVSGARLACKRKPALHVGDERELTIEATTPFRARVRVVWVKQLGFFRREIGVEFMARDEALTAALTDLLKASMFNHTLERLELDRQTA
jgi:hypothetical protein